MADSEFVTEAIAAFNAGARAFALWLEENVAEEGHSHEIEDVEGLAEALGEEVDE